MGAGDQFADAPAAPVGEVSKGHAGGAVGEEGLVDVALVGVVEADESGHAVETLRFVLAEVQEEGDQCGHDGAEVHVGEVFTQAKKELFYRVQACFVETVSGQDKYHKYLIITNPQIKALFKKKKKNCTVPGYFSNLHVLWNRMRANFLFPKELFSQIVVDVPVWSHGPGATVPSSHIPVSHDSYTENEEIEYTQLS